MNCIYKNRFGLTGEIKAKQYLEKKGLKFVKKNYRYDRAEIDLIFEDVEKITLVFAEVKTRSNKKFGDPIESVTKSKQNQIRKAAMGFIQENPEYSNHDLRLDVITIMITGSKTEISHYENAF